MPKQQQSLDELLGSFTAQIERTVRAPNVYRYVPLPQQELFQQSQTKNRILFGGNRGGKTFGAGADEIQCLLHRHPYRQHLYPDGPLRMRWIGVDFLEGIDQIALPLFQQLIPPSFLIDGAWERSYRKADHMLVLADGATVSFMSYEQDPNKFQGVSLHHVHMDEEPPKPIFEESTLRLLDTNGTWTISETPVQQLEWIQDELIEPAESGARPDISVFYLNTMDNTYLSMEAKLELFGNMSEEDKLIRMAGKYKGGNLVFPEFERKWPFIMPEESFHLTRDWAVYESMDWGYKNPTAWVWTAVHPDGSIVTFEILYQKGIVVSDWAKIVLQARKRIAARYGLTDAQFAEMLVVTIGDPSIGDQGNSSAQTGMTHQQVFSSGGVYIATEGIRAMRASNQNVGLDRIHTYLKKRPSNHPKGDLPWWQMTANCTALADELKKARVPRQSLNNQMVKNASEQIRDKDNHAIDAVKYLFMLMQDLRPESYKADESAANLAVARELNPASYPSVTHADAYAANMKPVTPWNVHGSDSYQAMEM